MELEDVEQEAKGIFMIHELEHFKLVIPPNKTLRNTENTRLQENTGSIEGTLPNPITLGS